jgi:hypothetical protein
VGPRSGLDDVEKRKFLHLPGLELRPFGCQARSQSLYRLRCPHSPILRNASINHKSVICIPWILLEDTQYRQTYVSYCLFIYGMLNYCQELRMLRQIVVVLINDELERMWKEGTVVWFKELHRLSSGGSDERNESFSRR